MGFGVASANRNRRQTGLGARKRSEMGWTGWIWNINSIMFKEEEREEN